MITPEDEGRYQLRPLPDVPFIGVEESAKRRAVYEAQRRRYRDLHPLLSKKDCE